MALNTNALTTVQRTADYLGLGTIANPSTNYTILEILINIASNWIQNTYLNRTIKRATYSNEEISSDGTGILTVKEYPISSTDSFQLEVRTSATNEDDWETVDPEDYYIDYESGIIRAVEGFKFVKGNNKYRATYVAGYNFDLSTTFLSSTGAADLEYVVWKIVGTLYDSRKGGVGVKSESIGDYSVTYSESKSIFESPEVTVVLDKYAKIGMGSYVTPRLT
jgi:hypothetical protein